MSGHIIADIVVGMWLSMTRIHRINFTAIDKMHLQTIRKATNHIIVNHVRLIIAPLTRAVDRQTGRRIMNNAPNIASVKEENNQLATSQPLARGKVVMRTHPIAISSSRDIGWLHNVLAAWYIMRDANDSGSGSTCTVTDSVVTERSVIQ